MVYFRSTIIPKSSDFKWIDVNLVRARGLFSKKTSSTPLLKSNASTGHKYLKSQPVFSILDHLLRQLKTAQDIPNFAQEWSSNRSSKADSEGFEIIAAIKAASPTLLKKLTQVTLWLRQSRAQSSQNTTRGLTQ